jgi:hypothetical protein
MKYRIARHKGTNSPYLRCFIVDPNPERGLFEQRVFLPVSLPPPWSVRVQYQGQLKQGTRYTPETRKNQLALALVSDHTIARQASLLG